MDLEKSTAQFNEVESRGSFYQMARNLINNGFNIEAYLLILATWNFANFRYAVKDFDIDNFKNTMDELERHFQKLDGENFININFDKHTDTIKEIYGELSSIKGIKYTGASKLMHLRCPNVFVMWDGYIKGDKPKKYYKQLDIVKNKEMKIKKYGSKSSGYLQFLKDMQKRYKESKITGNKPLTKLIDEYNFLNITIPIQEIEKMERK